MYISVNKCFELDKIVKGFEVAYRSFVVDNLKSQYPTEDDFKIALERIDKEFSKTSIINTYKYKSKLEKIKRKYKSHYKIIDECNNSISTWKPIDHVPYVNEIIDYVSIFFNECFLKTELLDEFTSTEELAYLSNVFHDTRNDLSHPASSKITIKSAKDVISFIRKVCKKLGMLYFWYMPLNEILSSINSLVLNLDNNPLKVHNLNEIAFPLNKIVCREDELQKLSDYILGRDEYYRRAGSVVIYGYGGVGKTALTIEFIHRTIKKIKDKKCDHFDFILFFTSKEEVLKFEETSGEVYIDKISMQISNFDDFISRLFTNLNISKIEQVKSNFERGLIIIDNIENLQKIEKDKFFDFIKKTPRNIHYIITSRDEEICEEKLNIREFKEVEKGKLFIKEFVHKNNLQIDVSADEAEQLVNASKGNTLILVLSLLSLNDGRNTMKETISELQFIESRNVETISDFMYKNTFDRCISFLEKDGYDPKSLIKIVSLYEEPIDLYSMSKLTKFKISEVEFICKILSKRLILDKKGEFYELNEFANSFIFIKLMPNRLEVKKLISKIKTHKKLIQERLSKLEDGKLKNDFLKKIMDDWKPRNYIDTMAIAAVYHLFEKVNHLRNNNDKTQIQSIVDEFKNNERITSHPYIRFQKAKVYWEFIKIKNGKYRKNLIPLIRRGFEDAIEGIEFSYSFIKNTKSHGSILWIYGIFLKQEMRDLERSTKYFEEARDILKNVKDARKNYYSVLSALTYNYFNLFKKTKDIAYRHRCTINHWDITNNSTEAINSGFKFKEYLHSYRVNIDNKYQKVP